MFKKIIKILLCIILAVVLAGAVGFKVYTDDYYHASDSAQTLCISDDQVSVSEKDGNTIFSPKNPVAGFIFYPGGKVEDKAYAPLLHKLAEKDVLCILVHMPYNLAVLNINGADGLKEQYPEIKNWYLSGHSLGGAMASSYMSNHTDDFQGLVLLASYSTKSLKQSNIKVLSMYGDQDQVLNQKSYKEYKENLPDDVNEVIIEGGCHGFFGDYGDQEGDGTPTISRDEQISITVENIIKLIKEA